jgi:hypothetical protein
MRRRLTITEQADSVEHFVKRRSNAIVTAMVDSSGWHELVQQLESLSEERLAHLRVLAARADGNLPADSALNHTLEVYSLSQLILALHHQLVAQSAVVSHVLNEWFRTHRGMSIVQFEAGIHLDCARALLLDVDYACPPRDVALRQLSLAEEHCRAACLPEDPPISPARALLAEIVLRGERLRR